MKLQKREKGTYVAPCPIEHIYPTLPIRLSSFAVFHFLPEFDGRFFAEKLSVNNLMDASEYVFGLAFPDL